MMKNFKKKILASAISFVALATASTVSHTSDVEVYKAATQGAPSILLMLDTSGSMGISSLVLPKNNAFGSPGDVTEALCEHREIDYAKQWQYNKVDKRGATIPVIGDPSRTVPNKTQNKTSFYHVARIGGQDIEFYTRGCEKTIIVDGRRQLVSMEDRLSRLKMALVELLAGQDLNDKMTIGLGHYSARAKPGSSTTLKVDNTNINLVDGHSGTILVSAKKLDNAQRVRLAKAITQFKSVDTTTDEEGNPVATDTVKFNSHLGNYAVSRLSPVTANPLDIYRAAGGTPTAHAYAEVAAYMMGTSTGGAPRDMNIKWLYDSTNILYNSADGKITYWVCVQTDPSRTTSAFNGKVPIKQCYNQEGDAKLKASYISYDRSRAYINDTYTELQKPDGNGGWTKVQTGPNGEAYDKLSVSYEGGKSPEHHIWQIMKQIPVGWRLGGSIKVAHEAMDIEPVSGGIWSAKDEVGYSRGNEEIRSLVTYRTNPFAYEQYDAQERLQCKDAGYTYTPQNPDYPCVKTNKEPVQGANWSSFRPNKPQACNENWYYNCEIDTRSFSWGNQYRWIGQHANNNVEKVRLSQEVDNIFGGMRYSDVDSMDSTKNQYKKVASTNACDGNGIYFLTDGAPNSTKDEMARTIMNHSLKDSQYQFSGKPTGNSVLRSPALLSGMFSGETGGWEYIGEYAKKLADPTKNPAGVSIKTAVVGFGSSFESAAGNCDLATNEDAKNACKWGGDDYGQGGFYYANNKEDIKNSIINFVSKVSTTVEPVSTGSAAIPANTFNPTQAPSKAYYGSFTPKPNSSTQIWLGNMNKYNIHNSQLVGQNNVPLFDRTGKLNQLASGLWSGGVLGQLALQKVNNENRFARQVYTDKTVTTDNPLLKVDTTTLFDRTGKLNDGQKNYWLNILGYNIDVNQNIADMNALSNYSTELRQLGAVMHSTPVLLTQEGKLTVERDEQTGKRTINSTGRKDYILYGTTQGLLHVVNTDDGKEKFSFVPEEMLKYQKEALLDENKSNKGISSLFYGIDAPWTSYTQYALKGDGTLTVNSSSHRYNKNTPNSLDTAAVQWVYGGLRMGGRGYYALDLTNIDEPKLKFSIRPDLAPADSPLRYMGQSWSKPTITRVRWKGQTRLVMFVGGGYDAGGTDGNGTFDAQGNRTGYDPTGNSYENPAYNQTNKRGAGVYMFDATNGDLLWWGGANVAATTPTGTNPDLAATKHEKMQYSVVSQIAAVDRDDDGLADHLYLGDLGGQGFRVDINNAKDTKSGDFVKRIERLFAEKETVTDGSKPRFYDMPSMSVHLDNGVRRAVVAFNSGNRSSPLAGTNAGTNNTTTTTVSALDSAYVVYDYNVTRSDLYTVTTNIERTTAPVWGTLNQHNGTPYNGTNTGWKYTYNAQAGALKGMGNIVTLGNFLYTSAYNKDGASGSSASSTCNAGVLGSTAMYRFCLPLGKCTAEHGFNTITGLSVDQPIKSDDKPGLVEDGFGKSSSDQKVGVVSIDENNCSTNPNGIKCREQDLAGKIKQLRWYEMN